MTLDILIALLALLTAINYWIRRSVLYPPFLFCGIWLIVTGLLRTNLIEMDPPHSVTITFLAAGAILFSIGGYLAFFIPGALIAVHLVIATKRHKNDARHAERRRPTNWRNLSIILVLLGTVGIQIHLVTQLAAQSNGEGGLLANAENADVENTANGTASPLEALDIPLLTVFFAVLFLQRSRGRMATIVVSFALLNCIFRGSRGALLILFSALLAVRLLERNRDRILPALRETRGAILFFVVLFSGLVIFKKDTSGVQTGLLTFAANALVQYIVGPLGALDHVLTHPSDYVGLPNHTFKLFLKLASTAGLISYVPPQGYNDWIAVPFLTNVYTAYKPFIADFGAPATLAIFALIGFLQTLLFRRAKIGGRLAVYMFALSVYPILMVIFDDVYTAYLYYLKGLVFALLYFAAKRVRLFASGDRKKLSTWGSVDSLG